MICAVIALFFLPTATIYLWGMMLKYLDLHSWSAYRLTGVIGVPIHELSHVLVCKLFGLKILRVSYFAPDPSTGELGVVHYQYNPKSHLHNIAIILQGIAPLVAGGAIATLVLGQLKAPIELLQAPGDLLGWGWSVAVSRVEGLWTLATGGLLQAGDSLLLLIVCMHAVPSLTDVRNGLPGAFRIAGVPVGAYVLVAVLGSAQIEPLSSWVVNAYEWFQAAVLFALGSAITVTTLALVSGALLVVLPAFIRKAWSARPGVPA